MSNRGTIAVLVVMLAAGLTWGQEPAPTAEDAQREVLSRIEEVRERLRRAMRLPRTAEEAREAGVDEETVKEVLETAREQGVPAGEMQGILEMENEAIREGAAPENFGAVVREMKASGLRGRALAEAIHAEQTLRGMKKAGEDKIRGKGKGRGKGARKGGRKP